MSSISIPETSLDPSEQKHRLRFILATLAFVIIWMMVNAYFMTGWITAFVLAYLVLAMDVIYIIRTDDSLLGKFLIFGLVGGFTELLADAWLVEKTKTLFYENPEPLLLDSPAYMPVAWTVVLVQIGYIGYWLYLKRGMLTATLVCGLIGGIIIPLYESFAKGAGWWHYEDLSRIIWNTPYYIILGEFLLALALPALLLWCSKKPFYWAIPIGIVMGLWIWIAYFISYSLLG